GAAGRRSIARDRITAADQTDRAACIASKLGSYRGSRMIVSVRLSSGSSSRWRSLLLRFAYTPKEEISHMETTPILYTERLILRPLELADAEAIQQQFPNWEVVRYLNARVPWPDRKS